MKFTFALAAVLAGAASANEVPSTSSYSYSYSYSYSMSGPSDEDIMLNCQENSGLSNPDLDWTDCDAVSALSDHLSGNEECASLFSSADLGFYEMAKECACGFAGFESITGEQCEYYFDMIDFYSQYDFEPVQHPCVQECDAAVTDMTCEAAEGFLACLETTCPSATVEAYHDPEFHIMQDCVCGNDGIDTDRACAIAGLIAGSESDDALWNFYFGSDPVPEYAKFCPDAPSFCDCHYDCGEPYGISQRPDFQDLEGAFQDIVQNHDADRADLLEQMQNPSCLQTCGLPESFSLSEYSLHGISFGYDYTFSYYDNAYYYTVSPMIPGHADEDNCRATDDIMECLYAECNSVYVDYWLINTMPWRDDVCGTRDYDETWRRRTEASGEIDFEAFKEKMTAARKLKAGSVDVCGCEEAQAVDCCGYVGTMDSYSYGSGSYGSGSYGSGSHGSGSYGYEFEPVHIDNFECDAASYFSVVMACGGGGPHMPGDHGSDFDRSYGSYGSYNDFPVCLGTCGVPATDPMTWDCDETSALTSCVEEACANDMEVMYLWPMINECICGGDCPSFSYDYGSYGHGSDFDRSYGSYFSYDYGSDDHPGEREMCNPQCFDSVKALGKVCNNGDKIDFGHEEMVFSVFEMNTMPELVDQGCGNILATPPATVVVVESAIKLPPMEIPDVASNPDDFRLFVSVIEKSLREATAANGLKITRINGQPVGGSSPERRLDAADVNVEFSIEVKQEIVNGDSESSTVAATSSIASSLAALQEEVETGAFTETVAEASVAVMEEEFGEDTSAWPPAAQVMSAAFEEVVVEEFVAPSVEQIAADAVVVVEEAYVPPETPEDLVDVNNPEDGGDGDGDDDADPGAGDDDVADPGAGDDDVADPGDGDGDDDDVAGTLMGGDASKTAAASLAVLAVTMAGMVMA